MKKYLFTESQIKKIVDVIVNEHTILKEDREILNLRDLAELLGRSEGMDKEFMFELIHDTYKDGGDEAIIKLFHDHTSLDITDISKGHYIMI